MLFVTSSNTKVQYSKDEQVLMFLLDPSHHSPYQNQSWRYPDPVLLVNVSTGYVSSQELARGTHQELLLPTVRVVEGV